jgi:tetratricopeptide (TPR) repeat protein
MEIQMNTIARRGALVAVGIVGLGLMSGCAKKHVNEQPIIENGDRVDDGSYTVAEARTRTEQRRADAAYDRNEIETQALATCEADVCDAVVRREVWLGMNEWQVMAATGTTERAWSTRRAGGSTVMTPSDTRMPPKDAVGQLTMVQLADGAVRRYGYQESQGVRLVSSPEHATTEGRAAEMAEALLQEGDRQAASGNFDAALNRYDRASILAPEDPLIDYRIATVLDKALRPIEAKLQYELFLHRLDLERIQAKGEANARLAEAIALAQQRIVVLERSR